MLLPRLGRRDGRDEWFGRCRRVGDGILDMSLIQLLFVLSTRRAQKCWTDLICWLRSEARNCKLCVWSVHVE
jgi:hypothetical protein